MRVILMMMIICHDNRFKETPKGVLQYFPDLMANLVWNATGMEKFSASRSGDLKKKKIWNPSPSRRLSSKHSCPLHTPLSQFRPFVIQTLLRRYIAQLSATYAAVLLLFTLIINRWENVCVVCCSFSLKW
jgi:hypothetical protein